MKTLLTFYTLLLISSVVYGQSKSYQQVESFFQVKFTHLFEMNHPAAKQTAYRIKTTLEYVQMAQTAGRSIESKGFVLNEAIVNCFGQFTVLHPFHAGWVNFSTDSLNTTFQISGYKSQQDDALVSIFIEKTAFGWDFSVELPEEEETWIFTISQSGFGSFRQIVDNHTKLSVNWAVDGLHSEVAMTAIKN